MATIFLCGGVIVSIFVSSDTTILVCSCFLDCTDSKVALVTSLLLRILTIILLHFTVTMYWNILAENTSSQVVKVTMR